MTVLVPEHPGWPDGDAGKVLLNCAISGNVDQVFEELFGSYPELQAKLHKQRSDSNCAESPWVSKRSELPSQQFVWPAPPAGADPGTPAQGRCRKVRFDAPASLASKSFSSEEIQTVLAFTPGSHYLVESEVFTSAMYGDQFAIISRYSLLARGAGSVHLHVLYAISFKPSLSRLVKPMVAKGVDGGIRGSFSLLKKLLQEQFSVTDLPDAEVPQLPGAGEAVAVVAEAEAAAAAAVPLPVAVGPAATAAPAAAAPGAPTLFSLADYVVYQELVSSILTVSDPAVVAKGLAMCLTLALINIIIAALRPITQGCAAAYAAGTGGLTGLLCWPFAVLLDIPDSLSEVLGALLLVAVANKLLLVGVEVASSALKGGSLAGVIPQRVPAPPAAVGSAGGAAAAWPVDGTAEVSATSGSASSSSSSGASAGTKGAVKGVDAASSDKPMPPTKQPQRQQNGPAGGKSSPMPIPGKGGSGGGGVGGSGSSESVNALSSFSNVMTGWGRNLLNGSVVDSITSNEGIKALVSGSWSKSSPDASKPVAAAASANDAGQGPGSAGGVGATRSDAAASAQHVSSSGTPARALSHRHTTSFTAVMDPSGLNIIEDYALQGLPSPAAAEALPRLAEEQGAAGSPASGTGALASLDAAAAVDEKHADQAAEANTTAAGSAAAGEQAVHKQQVEARAAGSSRNSPHHSPARPASPSKAPAGPAAAAAASKAANSRVAAAAEGAGPEDLQPLLAPSSTSNGGEAATASSIKQGTGGNLEPADGQGLGLGSESPTPVPLDNTVPSSASVSPGKAAPPPQQQSVGGRPGKAVSFSHPSNSPDNSPSSSSPNTKTASGLVGYGALASRSSPAASSRSSPSPLARRSASPMVYGASGLSAGLTSSSSPALRGSLLGASASYEALPTSSFSGALAAAGSVEPGEEEEDEVLVEVFEHERVQPFRGWGHSWPGHFLPSDKVGHWGDRTGAPGGATSMLFDRVAPKLPVGWAWRDPEWSVDMTGEEVEGCDTEGWSYGMDFSWLTWPPAPQMGKPGIKSFVRRRRWVRTRERLPPGTFTPDSQEQLSQQPADDAASTPAAEQLASRSAPNTYRGTGSSESGLMAGLGAGLGLEATAAAAAASAMVSRFMRAVQDLPLSPMSSSGGSEPGLGPAPAAGATKRAAQELLASPISSSGGGAPGPSGSSTAPNLAELSSRAAPTATAQQQQGPGTSCTGVGKDPASSSSSEGGSSGPAGDSGFLSDSDSSSVDSSGAPPPRPRLSEALAQLEDEQVGGQQATASAPDAEGAGAAGTSGTFESAATSPPGSSDVASGAVDSAAPAAAGTGLPLAVSAPAAAASGLPPHMVEAEQGPQPATSGDGEAAGPAGAAAGAADTDVLPAASDSTPVASTAVASTAAQDHEPQKGLVLMAPSHTTSTSTAVAAQPSTSAAATDTGAASIPDSPDPGPELPAAAQPAHTLSSQCPAVSSGEAVPGTGATADDGGTPELAMGVAAGQHVVSSIALVPGSVQEGKGGTSLGRDEWVWTAAAEPCDVQATAPAAAAAAVEGEPAAASRDNQIASSSRKAPVSAKHQPAVSSPSQQGGSSFRADATGGAESQQSAAGSSSMDSSSHQQPSSVSRGAGTSRIARTGSGRSKPRLGAVPLRHGREGSASGGGSSSTGGTAGTGSAACVEAAALAAAEAASCAADSVASPTSSSGMHVRDATPAAAVAAVAAPVTTTTAAAAAGEVPHHHLVMSWAVGWTGPHRPTTLPDMVCSNLGPITAEQHMCIELSLTSGSKSYRPLVGFGWWCRVPWRHVAVQRMVCSIGR